jgi:glycosyltransferase involved in cell wall biosynthesis
MKAVGDNTVGPPLPISLVVVTRNEERNIARCLDAADFCAEKLVVDSGSTDRTVEIARERGARVLTREWTGYRDQKNFGVEQAAGPWVLCLDADEVVTPELRASILAAFVAGDPVADAFEINRHGVYGGQPINHSGWYPEWRTFLYRQGRAVWAGREPHPYVEVQGRVCERLAGDLLHYTYADLGEHLRKNDASARAAAAAMHADGRRTGWFDLLVRPGFAALRRLVLQRAFLDGFRGVSIAVMAGVYTYLKYAYLKETRDRTE